MIESCPRKRMLLSVSFLGLFTVLVLIVESHWTGQKDPLNQVHKVEQNSTCYENLSFKVIKACEPCKDFEIVSKSVGACAETHYKEVLECASGEVITRSCDKVSYLKEHTFWKFEGFMLFAFLLSTACTISRKKALNQIVIQRMHRQLANSV